MLGNIDLNKKSYEQILKESIAQIPIYSKDWTNYNVSDPGITILENLSAFSALMQSEINEVPLKTKLKLLNLAGFYASTGRTATAYVKPKHLDCGKAIDLPHGAKLYAQDICFEFANEDNGANQKIKNLEITKLSNYNILLDSFGVKGGVYLLGKEPHAGDGFLIYLSDIPDAGQEVAIHFEMEKTFNRNKFDEGRDNPFAEVVWEIVTKEGYRKLGVEDGTHCFMESGYVKFSIDSDLHNLVKDSDEYVIRVSLNRAQYDIVPRFKRISGLLTRIVQKDTKAFVEIKQIEDGADGLILENYILDNGYPEIYCLQEDGTYSIIGAKWHCNIEPVGKYSIKVTFNEDVPKSVMAVYRDASVMAYRELGMLYGYDEQVLELPPMEKVYGKRFSLIIEYDQKCHIVYPESTDKGEVIYSLSETDNNIVIHDCGKYEGARVRLGDYVVYMGERADVVPEIEMEMMPDGNRTVSFVNIATGEKGNYSEDFEKLRHRFVNDIKNPVTLVTQNDCMKIVGSVPALSIHKIGVSTDNRQNKIYIAIKPNSSEKYPMLSDIYINEVKNYLEQYRMLTSTVVITQPVYVPINVSGMVYTKKYFKFSRQTIEEKLMVMLDGVNSDIGFGSLIVFHEIYEKLMSLECVEEIAELNIFPDSYRNVSMMGLDMKFTANALFYPGNINIDITEI